MTIKTSSVSKRIKCEREMDWDHLKTEMHRRVTRVLLEGDGQCELKENRGLFLLTHFLHFRLYVKTPLDLVLGLTSASVQSALGGKNIHWGPRQALEGHLSIIWAQGRFAPTLEGGSQGPIGVTRAYGGLSRVTFWHSFRLKVCSSRLQFRGQ